MSSPAPETVKRGPGVAAGSWERVNDSSFSFGFAAQGKDSR